MKCEVPVVPPVLGNQGEATIPEVADTKVKARDAKQPAFWKILCGHITT